MTTLSIFNYRAVQWAGRQPIDNSLMETLTAIAACAHNGGKCWPTQADLVRLTKQSETTVRRNMRRLEVEGYIKVERGGCSCTSIITIMTERVSPPTFERSAG